MNPSIPKTNGRLDDVEAMAMNESSKGIHIDDVWEFAGQQLKPSDFNTAIVHLYRAEVTRANVWRNRLDTTTNWAVITTGAALSFTFGSPASTPLVIILDTILTLLFLFIEARRYRYYELWAYRVRLIENQFYAKLLAPPFKPDPQWAETLAENLLHPRFNIGLLEAFGRRYRRNYAFLFWILALGWVMKIAIHPEPVHDLDEFLARAAVGDVPAWFVIGAGFVFHGALNALGLLTVAIRDSQGEVFDEILNLSPLRRFGHRVRRAIWETLEIDVRPLLPKIGGHHDQLVYIITDKPEIVGNAILLQTGRGITTIEGKGMYTGQPHSVLMCVYHAPQAAKVKQIVKETDPKAFIIITDVKNVHGRGFQPLEA